MINPVRIMRGERFLARLTKDQIRFLERHGIPLSETFDASGHSRASYSARMRELGMVVAYTLPTATSRLINSLGYLCPAHVPCMSRKPSELCWVSELLNRLEAFAQSFSL